MTLQDEKITIKIRKNLGILTGFQDLQGNISEGSFLLIKCGEIRLKDSEFEYYVRLYRKNVLTAALCLVQNESDAEDITQEVFIRLYKYNGWFDSDRHIKNWLIRCAINRAKTLLGSRWHKYSQPLETAAELTHTDRYNEGDRVLELMGKISPNNRIVLHMYYYEEYTAEEIAKILGISANAVSLRLSRGRQQLKELLSEEGSDT